MSEQTYLWRHAALLAFLDPEDEELRVAIAHHLFARDAAVGSVSSPDRYKAHAIEVLVALRRFLSRARGETDQA